MTSKKLAIILASAVGLVCLLILGGAYEINTLLQSRSQALSVLKSTSASLNDKQLQALRNKQDLKTYADLNTIAQSIVPQDKSSDVVVRQIINLAQASGIGSLKGGITLPSSTLGGTGTSSPTADNPNSSTNSLTQLSKVPGLSGVYDLPITVQQNDPVRYSAFLTFLSKLQQNRRTASISSVNVQPSTAGNTVTFSLTIDEYIKP